MSVVLAWGDGQRVVMAGDRQASSSDNSRAWNVAKINRLLVPSDSESAAPVEMLIGTTGSLVATCLSRHALTPPEAPSARTVVDQVQWWQDLDLERWAWRLGVQFDRLMREHHAVVDDDDEVEGADYDAVVAFRGHVFEIGNSTVVAGHRVGDGFLAGAGNGSGYGLGAANALIADGHEPVDALKRAVEITCDHNPLCGGGIDVQELC